MVDWETVFKGLVLITTWKLPVVVTLGLWFGLILGVIPGMAGSLGIAIILPVTFLMDPVTALVLLTSVYTGGLTGAGITAILINTPGQASAIATTFDGYPMTRMGYHNEALGLQITSSVIGGFSSYLFLLFFIKPIARLALLFGPSEMLFFTILVLVVIGTVRGKHLFRSLFIGFFGLLLGTVGASEATGVVRGTMGFFSLEDGIPIVPCIIGVFAMPEILNLLTREFITEVKVEKAFDIRKLLHGARNTFRYVKTLLRSAILGIFIGILPAAGSTIACLFSYAQAKRVSKWSHRFGTGEPEGVVAAETANNASEGGAMATLLALGIPGSAATAILIAGFMLHGLVPGPRLFVSYGELVYAIICANLFQMLLVGFFAIGITFYMTRIVVAPSIILAPSLMVVMAMGIYSVRFMFFDVHMLFLFGILGWFFRACDFAPTSFIIGIILGKNLDMDMYRYVALFGSNLTVFVKHPISACIILLTLVILGFQIYHYWHKSLKEDTIIEESS